MIQLAVAEKRAELVGREKIGESISPVPVTALAFFSIPVPVSVPALTPSPIPVSAIALSQVPVSPSF